MLDWLDSVLRLLIVLGMFYGAYRTYKASRAAETWSNTAALLSLLLLIIYAAGAVLLFVGWGTAESSHTYGWFAGLAVYLIGGLYLIAKLSHRIQAKFSHSRK